jgi:hypothetical protein
VLSACACVRDVEVLLYFLLQFIMALVLNFSTSPVLQKGLSMTPIPTDYRFKLFLLAMLYSACAVAYERWMVPHVSDDEDPVPEVSLPAVDQGASKCVCISKYRSGESQGGTEQGPCLRLD